MELIIPYLMALAGFFIINKDRSNRIVTVLFVFFLSADNLACEMMPVGPDIYLVELALITLFFVTVALCIAALNIKVTMMILILCTVDITIALMDIVAFLTYHGDAQGVYAIAYDAIITLAVIQFAALWVNDARRINVGSRSANIRMYFRNLVVRTLYR